jgi:hypothetical protein
VISKREEEEERFAAAAARKRPIEKSLHMYGHPAKLLVELTVENGNRIVVDLTDKATITSGHYSRIELVFKGEVERAIDSAITRAEFTGLA